MRKVLVMGAASAIAEATAREFAKRGDALVLVGRSAERLQAIADDLRLRGAAQAVPYTMDARDIAGMPAMLRHAGQALGGLDVALIAHGTLSDQKACEQAIDLTLDEFSTNALSVIALCTLLANDFEAQGHGTIAVISSVAGDRGRQSNYVYGSAKAAVSAFCSGLRQRLYPRGVHVVTIKPGFVDTPMTAGLRKGVLWASPAKVGAQIFSGIVRNRSVVYTPGFWWLIMLVIRSIPEFVFRRLRL